MLWLVATISAYFILAIVFLVDKYLLTGPVSNPKVYSFYVGVLGGLAALLIPFVGFSLPTASQTALSLAAGAFFVISIYWFYKAISLFEVSRVTPAVGGFLPVFTFLLVFFLSKGQEQIGFLELLSFILLVLGGFLITYQKDKKISLACLKISALSAFFLALFFVLSKYVYLELPFWTGLIWMKIGGFLLALLFLFSKAVREEIFSRKKALPKKTAGVFLVNQAAGAGANILENFAVALAPLAFLPIINALQGVQYVFLLLFVVLISLKAPKLFKEEISKKAMLQKISATLLIILGLAALAIK
jgi:drug/metabolite transporter (DMT)-like permease